MSWYLEALKKYAVFQGRARRKEYWYFVLFNVLISAVLAFVDGATGTYNADLGMGLLGGLYGLAIFIPSLAVLVRRLHDTDRTGWWALAALVPIAGAILLIVFAVQDGTAGANQYGANPKEAAPAQVGISPS